MSAREYADPRLWREIANANDIDDPMDVKPGTVLKLPPLY
jgi:nucleoid-associated protein YgaU